MMIVAEFGAVFYSVKFKDFDDRGMRRQADREFSRKAELESQIAKQREEYVTDDLTKWLFLFTIVAVTHGKRQRKLSQSRFRVEAAQRSLCLERRDILALQAIGLVRHLEDESGYDGCIHSWVACVFHFINSVTSSYAPYSFAHVTLAGISDKAGRVTRY